MAFVRGMDKTRRPAEQCGHWPAAVVNGRGDNVGQHGEKCPMLLRHAVMQSADHMAESAQLLGLALAIMKHIRTVIHVFGFLAAGATLAAQWNPVVLASGEWQGRWRAKYPLPARC